MFAMDWLAKRAELSPNQIALTIQKTGESITYADWNASSNQVAHWLLSLGIQKGDRVAVLAMNCKEYLDIWFACGKIGAILQNLNWRLTNDELCKLISDATPDVLIYGPSFVERVKELQANTTSIKEWFALSDKASEEDAAFQKGMLKCPKNAVPPIELTPDTPWVICYTGGTTGLPKGAIISHGNVTANAINTVSSWGLDANDVAILNAPLFHVGGLNVFTSPLVYMGGRSILCESFDVDKVFDLVESGGVTVFFGVPTMFIMMQEHPRWEEADFSKLKFVISGGASCPLPVFEKFWAKGVSFKTGYGLTEAGPNTFWLPEEDVQKKPGSVGFPLMHIQVAVREVRDDNKEEGALHLSNNGKEVEGELLIRGPHVIQGYWNQPEASAKALEGGWLRTGDLVRKDKDGYFYIIGRLKDMFISGGENVYPAEIESTLHEHAAVAEAAVIGVPEPKWGEVGLALIRLHEESADTDAAELLTYCKERLAGYKVPRKMQFVSEIPKTGAGKIDKKLLQKQFGN